MKKQIVGIVVLMLVATTVVSATQVNVKDNNQMTKSGVDVPVWKKGDSWMYKDHQVQFAYKKDGTVWYSVFFNYNETDTITDDTGGNYTMKITITNDQCRETWGSFRLEYTPLTKFTWEIILRKTDLALVSQSYQIKGLVFWLIGKINFPIPAQFSNTNEWTNTPPSVVFPFPLTAGTNGTIANSSYTGHQKVSLYWGLIKLFKADYSGYSGKQNYTCKMANISVPAGTYDAYNVSVESTYGLGHSISWSYYAPEAGYYVKQYIDDSWNETGKPGYFYESELVSTTYTP